MREYYAAACEEADPDLCGEVEDLIRESGWTWRAVCAVVCLAGGVVSPFLGATFDVTSWFAASQAVISRLHVLSIVSCALTLPLLVLGGCCLDLLEKKAGPPG